MPDCAKCHHSCSGANCPLCGSPAPLTWKEMNRATRAYTWMNFGGFVASILIDYRYPLLDLNTILLTALAVFLVPFLLQIVLMVTKQASTRFALLRDA